MKKKNIIIISVCLAVFVLALVLPSVFLRRHDAQNGDSARNIYLSYMEKVKTYEHSTEGMSNYFPIPEGYLEGEHEDSDFMAAVNPYDTPEQWESLKGVDARVEASQIVDKVLKAASTREIVIYCMNYNLYPEVLYYGSYDEGVAVANEHFNGFTALFEHPDYAQALLDLYAAYDLEYQSNHDAQYATRLAYIHALFYRLILDAQLDADQAQHFARMCFANLSTILNSDGRYEPNLCMFVGVFALYCSDENFTALIDSIPIAGQYILDANIDEASAISDPDLDRIVNYIKEFMAEPAE